MFKTNFKKKPKKDNLKMLKKKLDVAFSDYIRYRGDYVKCVTCGKVAPPKEMQAGHYISRSCMALRWDERNVFIQCIGCNIFKKGAYPEYTEFIINNYGIEHLNWLLRMKNEIKHWTTDELKELIIFYKSKQYGNNIR